MVRVFVGDDDGGERMRIVPRSLHAFEGFAAGNSRIDQNARRRTLHNRAVSPAATGQHRNRHTHGRRILPRAVKTEVTFWTAGTFGWGSCQLSALSSQLSAISARLTLSVWRFGSGERKLARLPAVEGWDWFSRELTTDSSKAFLQNHPLIAHSPGDVFA